MNCIFEAVSGILGTSRSTKQKGYKVHRNRKNRLIIVVVTRARAY